MGSSGSKKQKDKTKLKQIMKYIPSIQVYMMFVLQFAKYFIPIKKEQDF